MNDGFYVGPTDSNGDLLFWIIVLAIASLIGLLSGDIWRSKGGRFLSGFLTGFALGPIGMIYTGFAKPGDLPCFYCKNRVSLEMTRCPTCLGNLRAFVEDEEPAEPSEPG